MANPLNKIKGAIASGAAKMGKATAAGSIQKAVEAKQKIVATGLAVKWGGLAGLIVFLIICIGGVVNGAGNAIQNLGSINCATHGGSKFISQAGDAGVTLDDDQKKSITGKIESGGCGGAGYNGQTYPPSQGIISTQWGAVDANHKNPHGGLDIASACGTPIYAFAGGEVTNVVLGSENMSSGGNWALPMGIITIKHTSEFSTRYLHTKGSTTTVAVGDIVSAGDPIGTQWSNGHSTGCHLHFETRLNGESVDPLPYLEGAGYPYSETTPYLESSFPPKPDPSTAPQQTTGEMYPPSSAKAIALELMPAYGWDESQFNSCLVPLWNRESGWRITAQNNAYAPGDPPTAEYQAYGIPQAAPGSKMATTGADWQTNPRTQVAWGLTYIKDRYGSPCKAWEHSENKNWY